jgi:type VI secretion system protein ImpA
MINIEELLSPVSAEEPCGADLAYDAATQELETVLLGKPETQFSPAEEPRWDCLALVRMEGLQGFRDGLAVIRGLLERYWDGLYPRLDPEDNNDPTERVNILSSMLTPLGSFDDPMQFLRRLREAKLSNSVQLGKFSLEEMSPSAVAGGTSAPPADSAQVQGSFRDTAPEKLEEIAAALGDSTSLAKAIDEQLTNTIGAGRAPDWAPLLGTLGEIRKAIAPFLPTPDEGEAGETAEGKAAGGGKSGEIHSRQDVVRMLDRLCDYYSRAEPSSPVPLLLRRAQRLAEMSFLEIINDLSPETLAPVQNVTGVKPAAS